MSEAPIRVALDFATNAMQLRGLNACDADVAAAVVAFLDALPHNYVPPGMHLQNGSFCKQIATAVEKVARDG